MVTEEASGSGWTHYGCGPVPAGCQGVLSTVSSWGREWHSCLLWQRDQCGPDARCPAVTGRGLATQLRDEGSWSLLKGWMVVVSSSAQGTLALRLLCVCSGNAWPVDWKKEILPLQQPREGVGPGSGLSACLMVSSWSPGMRCPGLLGAVHGAGCQGGHHCCRLEKGSVWGSRWQCPVTGAAHEDLAVCGEFCAGPFSDESLAL